MTNTPDDMAPSPPTTTPSTSSPIMRWCAIAVFSATLLPLAVMTCMANGLSLVVSLVIVAVGCALVLPRAARRMPATLTGDRASGRDGGRTVFLTWIALGLFAGYQLTCLGVFMFDATKTDYAIAPTMRPLSDPELAKPFFPKHNCFTSYMVGSHLAASGADNIYKADQYRNPEQDTPIHATIGDLLTIDRYQYPPPFLLLPRALATVAGDFFRMRADWYALNLVTFSIAIGALAVFVGGRTFNAYWLIWPLVIAAPTALTTLQVGNVHLLIITIAMLAMLCFETRRNTLGGLLLGLAIVSKLFPGVLLAYLLFRRRWRAAIHTIAAMVALCALTLIVFGTAPFKAFFGYQLERLANTEAFSFAFEYIRAIAVNSSVTGIAYKLEKLHWLSGDPATVAKALTWTLTALLLVVVVVTGVRHRRRFDVSPRAESTTDGRAGDGRTGLVASWLILLILGQLRSPFLPWGYGNVANLWLIALLIAAVLHASNMASGRWWKVGALGLLWLVFALNVPLPYGPDSLGLDMAYTLGALAAVMTICLALVLRPSLLDRAPPETLEH